MHLAQQTVEDSRANICNTSSGVCYPYEQCEFNTSYSSGVCCVPGCYQLCSAEHQECLYEDGTTAVCGYNDLIFFLNRHVHGHTHTHTHTHTYTYTHTQIHTHIHPYQGLYSHTHARTYASKKQIHNDSNLK